MAQPQEQHRVVIVGAGFAGFNAARELVRLAGATTEITVINSTDYFLYLPLMPQVTGGVVEPGHIRVSLPRRLRKTRFVLGTVTHVDVERNVVSWKRHHGGRAKSLVALTALYSSGRSQDGAAARKAPGGNRGSGLRRL
jgi:NADH dehydrogenase